jgi:antitoxin component YwqK of YwqJK toxin-antitoxin module
LNGHLFSSIGSPSKNSSHLTQAFYNSESFNPSIGYDPYTSQSDQLNRIQAIQAQQDHQIDSLYSTNKSQSIKKSSPKKQNFHNRLDSPIKKDMMKQFNHKIPTIVEKEYEGDFMLGEMCGKGRIFDPEGFLLFEGRFRDNTQNGLGIEYYLDGRIYEGFFESGKKSGHGKIYSANGELMYDGNFKSGLMHGYGCLYYENGDIYKGNFMSNMKHGAGTFSRPNGTYF